MKKILLILAFLLILIAIPLTVYLTKQRQEIRQRATAATALYLEPATITAQPNQQFEVLVKADTGANQLTAVELHLNFSALYLEALSIQTADSLPNVLQQGVVQNGSASITVGSSVSNTSQGVHGIGTVAKITFKALQVTETPTIIQFSSNTQASGIDDPGTNVIVSKSSASVTIQATQGTTPSPTPAAPPAVSPSPGGATPHPSASATPLPSATPGTGGTNPSPTPQVSPSGTQKTTKITTPATGSTATTKRPTITGVSFPNALIVLSISNTQIAYSSYANASGNFSYTPTVDLANGTYTLTVTGSDMSSGTPETATSTFIVNASGTGGTSLTATPSPATTPKSSTVSTTTTPSSSGTSSEIPVTGNSETTVLLFGLALILVFFGGVTIFIK